MVDLHFAGLGLGCGPTENQQIVNFQPVDKEREIFALALKLGIFYQKKGNL